MSSPFPALDGSYGAPNVESRTSQTVALELFVERRRRDAEQPRRLDLVAAREREGLPDGDVLERRERLPAQREPLERRRRRRLGREAQGRRLEHARVDEGQR